MRGLAFHKPFCTFIPIIEPLRARKTNAIVWKLLVTCMEKNLIGFHCVFCKPIVKQCGLQCPCHHWFGKIVNALWMNLNFEDAWYYLLLPIIGNHFFCEWEWIIRFLSFFFSCLYVEIYSKDLTEAEIPQILNLLKSDWQILKKTRGIENHYMLR